MAISRQLLQTEKYKYRERSSAPLVTARATDQISMRVAGAGYAGKRAFRYTHPVCGTHDDTAEPQISTRRLIWLVGEYESPPNPFYKKSPIPNGVGDIFVEI